MHKITYLFLLTIVVATNCAIAQSTETTDTTTFFDATRNRRIPVALYKPTTNKPKLVILSHGYGENNGKSYLGYSFLTEYLAAQGYFVVSIQHELTTDSLIPTTGIPQVVRRPFWERGADNIRFVINELKKRYPQPDFKHITLIGHSNGGDMTALFPVKYPGMVEKIITLDNRRMPLPLTTQPQVYSLRSSDQPADEGVLPTAAAQQQYKITIIQLPNTIHNHMNDGANTAQREEMRKYIMGFLKS